MSEFQPGTLAMVIGHQSPEGVKFLGSVITLTNKVERVLGYYWHFTTGEGRPINEKYLLPIKPEADPLDVTHKEELHA